MVFSAKGFPFLTPVPSTGATPEEWTSYSTGQDSRDSWDFLFGLDWLQLQWHIEVSPHNRKWQK